MPDHILLRYRAEDCGTPYILHPTPYTLHPTPYTLHPTLFTLHPTSYSLHSTQVATDGVMAMESSTASLSACKVEHTTQVIRPPQFYYG